MESANHSKRGFPGCRPPCVLPVSPEENETHENGCVKSSLLVSPEFAGTSGFMSIWRKENRRRGPVQAGNRHWDMTVQQSWELQKEQRGVFIISDDMMIHFRNYTKSWFKIPCIQLENHGLALFFCFHCPLSIQVYKTGFTAVSVIQPWL